MFSKSIVDVSYSSAMLGHHRTKSNGPQARRGGERMALCRATVGKRCRVRRRGSSSLSQREREHGSMARASGGDTLSNGGSVPRGYSPHTYSPHNMGMYTRHEAQQPRPGAAL